MPDLSTDNIDITGCDAEPIHVPGSIQPHGVLLALGPAPDLLVEQVSANAASLLGKTPDALLGQPFDTLFTEARSLGDILRDGATVQQLPVVLGTVTASDGTQTLPLIAHQRADGVAGFVVELEAHKAESEADADSFFRFVNQTFLQLRGAPDRQALYERTVNEVRRLTGFDRVMLYQFHPDEHGEVIAEARRDDLDPFLGLHYPAGDIPRQARAMYVRSHIRLIANVGYQPVPLLARTAGPPLDLTHASLRSVSPIHIQYLKNMGVGASMSISIVNEDRLWGLIACHHDSPRYLSYQTRNVCELIGQTVAAQIVAYDAREELAAREHARQTVDHLTGLMAVGNPAAALTGTPAAASALMGLVGANGVAVQLASGDDSQTPAVSLTGETPAQEQVRQLIDYLAANTSDDIFETNSLSAFYPPARDFVASASGLLAIAVSRPQATRSYVLFFRPEVISTVHWAGDPTLKSEPQSRSEGPINPALTPRASFTLWGQTVREQGQPWSASDCDAADMLRRAIVGVLLRRAQLSLAAANEELRRSNDELDAFAFVASHDLREPLRGIRNYSGFLSEDYRTVLDAEGFGMIDTIQRLTKRMEHFLDSLLEYSRVGSTELLLRPVDMNVLVAEALEVLSFLLKDREVDIRIPRRLPSALADPIRAAEVWTNLITNASKYNNSEQKWIEIGYLDRDVNEPNLPTIYYVRDNGIGIEERNFQTVFLLFRRLHEREQFGGGTGSGLTIARRIVNRHGGKIWVESKPGSGSTFFFTLAADREAEATSGTNAPN